MLSFTTYKLIHLLGIAGILVVLGSVCIQASNGLQRDQNRFGKLLSIIHGVGSFLILLSGFGMLAKLAQDGGSAVPPWVWPKLGVWLLLSLAIGVPYRRPRWAIGIALALPLLVVFAAFFALYKPF
jgi:uncharacterized membrane protein SirB2